MSKEKSKSKEEKQERRITAIVDKQLGRALSLSTARNDGRYTLDFIYFNSNDKVLVATNARAMLIVFPKPRGSLTEIYELETGLYEITNGRLFKIDREDINFPKYQGIVPKAKQICTGEALRGIIQCMIENKVYVNIWKFAKVLRILDKYSPDWIFTNNSPEEPVMMETENGFYKIQYIMMPYRNK